MAEWTIATVCKTVARKGSAGSNPAPSTKISYRIDRKFLWGRIESLRFAIVKQYHNSDYDSSVTIRRIRVSEFAHPAPNMPTWLSGRAPHW